MVHCSFTWFRKVVILPRGGTYRVRVCARAQNYVDKGPFLADFLKTWVGYPEIDEE